MNESAISEKALVESEKPVQSMDNVQLPPFPDPSDEDFEDDISEEEKIFYKTKFADLSNVREFKLHCTACDRHLGCSARNESKMRMHPLLRTLVCQTCFTFYNSGEFEKGDDGSELYCRWCGQGGQVYCCSDCPHVFCARCIRRNLGAPKIKEIENADDWKCFKCSPNCLRELRALCWALLRYCELKNKLVPSTEDPVLKETYQNYCVLDDSKCCKQKLSKRKEKEVPKKKEEPKKTSTEALISKIPSTIQVKKFASINLEELPKPPRKAQKRAASPRHKPAIIKNPLAIPSSPTVINQLMPLAKKMKLQPVVASYSRIRPKGQIMPSMPIPILSGAFNGFNSNNMFNNSMNNLTNDNINLSLESLTQGVDMASMTAITNNNDNDVVCTPDLPMEPLCEVTEDNDDDVQCMTPAPVAPPKLSLNPPPLIARTGNIIPEINSENIIQMTENDVTVNAATGGLKFRVDPQTLSSNKMYRLPDGRIFAINANPQMPGGYSATIVALTESNSQAPPRGATYAAKLSAVSSANTSKSLTSPSLPQESNRNVFKCKNITTMTMASRNKSKASESLKCVESPRICDLNVPVEWYRYNLIDAVDALEYSLARLSKLKKETTSMYLRTRSVHEMRTLHRRLERLLNTSTSRFIEIKENLNKGMKQYITKKMGNDPSDDDDDVEILPDLEGNDDPIFIDENSVDSNANESQEVDLTVASSDQNDSGENREDPLNVIEEVHDMTDVSYGNNMSVDEPTTNSGDVHIVDNHESTEDNHQEPSKKTDDETIKPVKNTNGDGENNKKASKKPHLSDETKKRVKSAKNDELNSTIEKRGDSLDVVKVEDEKQNNPKGNNDDAAKTKTTTDALNGDASNQELDTDDKTQDGEMSEEMIETLLKDDGGGDDDLSNLNCLEELQDT